MARDAQVIVRTLPIEFEVSLDSKSLQMLYVFRLQTTLLVVMVYEERTAGARCIYQYEKVCSRWRTNEFNFWWFSPQYSTGVVPFR